MDSTDEVAFPLIDDLAKGCNAGTLSCGEQTRFLIEIIMRESPRIAKEIEEVTQKNPPLGALLEKHLADMEDHSPETYTHSLRVAALAARAAESFRAGGTRYALTSREDAILALGAALHDCGKLYMPLEILHHPGQIIEDEHKKIMRQHVVYSEHMIDALAIPTKLKEGLNNIVATHHEDMQGEGYPKKIRTEEKPFIWRVLPIIDRYDALTGGRSYLPKGMEPEKALGRLKNDVDVGKLDEALFVHLTPLLKKPVNIEVDKSWAQGLNRPSGDVGRMLGH